MSTLVLVSSSEIGGGGVGGGGVVGGGSNAEIRVLL